MDIPSVSSTPPPAREALAFGTSATAVAMGAEVSMSGSTAAGPQKAPEPPVKLLDMKSALSQANQMLQQNSTSLEFQVDPASKQTVVKMVDVTSNQVIKQFPSEEFLRMASVVDSLQKQLVNEKV